MPTTTDEIYWKLKNNPRYFKETQLYIQTKGKGLIPFVMNKAQLKIQVEVDRQRSLNLGVRIIVLKSRQTGVSTNTEGDIFQDTTTHENTISLIIAHDKESTQHLFEMSKLFYDMMDIDLRPMKRKSNRNELLFANPNEKERRKKPGLRSKIRVETAGNLRAGRSLTIHNLHISELAFWENPEQVMTGLDKGLVDGPGTYCLIESTANGAGGKFYEVWQDAVRGDNEYVPIFIGWFEDDTCTMEPPKDYVLTDFEHPMYGNEEDIKARFQLSTSQMYWRRWTIRNKCGNKLENFHQEYPSTPDEAFLVSGRTVFDGKALEDAYKWISRPSIGDLDIKTEYKTYRHHVKGRLKQWIAPEKGNRYAIGVDCAQGLAGRDFNCAEIFDVFNYEQVAEFHTVIGQEAFADELARLGRYYNKALIVVENNYGQVCLSYLKPQYSRLYYSRRYGRRHDDVTEELGFKTTGKTKGLLIANFKQLFEDDELLINGVESLDEMKVFQEEEYDPQKPMKVLQIRASGNNKDDRVIAIALALVGLRHVAPRVDKPKAPKRNPYYVPNKFTGR